MSPQLQAAAITAGTIWILSTAAIAWIIAQALREPLCEQPTEPLDTLEVLFLLPSFQRA